MDAASLKSRALEEQTEHAIIVLDDAGVVIGWDRAATKLLGYTPDEAIGLPLQTFFPKEDLQRGEPENELANARSYGRGEDDRWMVRKDKSQFWANGVVTPVHDENRSLVGYLKILRDRSDTRMQLDATGNRLDALEKAESRQHVFLATLSHELRNPLATVATASRVLQLSSQNWPGLEKPIAIIGRQVEVIDSLLADLADFARGKEGKLELHPEEIDLRSVIEKAIETCQPALAGRRQSVEVLTSNPIVLQADPSRLQRVLVNLIANASKFSALGSNIWVRGTVEDGEAVIRVGDKGVGITPEFLPHIFELFTRAGLGSGGQPTEGMGLGLPLVKSLVELHGGTVQAKSEGPDKGAEIIVHLPLQRPY